MTSEYIKSPIFHAWKSMAVTQEETYDHLGWCPAKTEKNLPSESKTSDKAKLIFQQAIQSGGQEFNWW